MRNKVVYPRSSRQREGWRERGHHVWSGWRDKLQRLINMHRIMVPVLTFLTLLVITLIGYAAVTDNRVRSTDSLVVIISHDKVEQTVPTTPTTVGGLLKKLNISVSEGDVVEPALATEIRQDDFRINVYRSKPVEVIDAGRRTLTFSAAATPRSIAMQSGTELYPEDIIEEQPVTDFLKDRTLGTKVIVERATPVSLNLYGQPLQIRTQAKTVQELLKERGIKLGKDDSVAPVETTVLTAQTQVFLLRQGTKIASITEDIAMPVEKINDPNLAMGTSAVRQQGSPGQKVVTYQLRLHNGVEVGRDVIQEVVVKNAVKEIVVQGTSLSGIKGNMALAGIAPSDYEYVDYIVSKESRWNPVAQNASGAYGLCQALPGAKMASAGADWATNPVTQLRWCNGYATARYGSWAAAYAFWTRNHYW